MLGAGPGGLRARARLLTANSPSAFIAQLLGHYGLRLSFTALDFLCCQAGGEGCVT